MASLAEIRARLQAQDSKKGGNNGSFGDGTVFPHWNIPEGTTSTVRLLPDGDNSNPFFWVEKAMIKLPFSGIIGGDAKPIIVQVPCMEMYGDACPVLTEVRPWFKDKNLEDMGRKYWKKRTYIYQGFIRESSLEEDKVPENPIRRLILSSQLFTLVKAALLDTELDNLPTDFDKGLDFKITKSSKGGFADYTTSSWARRESALTAEERGAIEQYGLPQLKEALPKKPNATELKIIHEMFEASVDGKSYDPEKWAAYFRPAGIENPNRESAKSAETYSTKPAAEPEPAAISNARRAATEAVQRAEPATTPAWEDDVAKAEVDLGVAKPATPPAAEPIPAGEDKAAAILAMIRSRQAKTA